MRFLRAPTSWFIAGLAIGGYFLVQWVGSIGGPAALRERFGFTAPLVTGLIQLALTPTGIPTDPIYIAHGALYGFWLAAPLNWLAAWLGGLLSYAVGLRARTDLDVERLLATLPAWVRRFPVSHPAFLILARQIPWAGSQLTTLVPAVMGVSFVRVTWCLAIAILPSAVVLAAVGAGLVRL